LNTSKPWREASNFSLQATKTRHTMCRKLFGQLGRVFAPELCTLGRVANSKSMRSSNKHERRTAAQAELERRWARAEQECPIPRAQVEALWDHVAEQVARQGHDHSFEFCSAWLVNQGIEPGPVLEFLGQHRVTDDFSLIIEGDPNKLFGPTAVRLARRPLEREALEALLSWLDPTLRQYGCDHSPRFAREWLAQHRFPVELAEMALLAQGGGCDCEIVMNVNPDQVYPQARPN
jgi:hypothetical protein